MRICFFFAFFISSFFIWLTKNRNLKKYYFFIDLNHASEQIVNVLFTTTEITAFSEVIGLLFPATVRVV
jgi:hypothetical protein